MKKHIPNFLTLMNLLSGCVGITIAFIGSLPLSAWFIGCAAVFDFLDGFSARLLHVKSDIGKQLDSLADIISFGLLPGVIMYQMLNACNNLPGTGYEIANPYPFLAFAIPAFSALRLAKFNIDTRQTDHFIGVPTPASAIFFGSLPLILWNSPFAAGKSFISVSLQNYYLLGGLILLFSVLMISSINLIALKFKNFKWQDNKPQYILLAFAIISFFLIGYLSVPASIAAYIILSVVYRKNFKRIDT